MRHFYKLLFFSIILISPTIIAQNIEVFGKVSDSETGMPLPGVNIIIEGTNNGTTSDFDGDYSLQVPEENSSLIFSYIGYLEQQIPLQGRSIINISLVPDSESLDEVVLIGYGAVRKSDLTGSVSQVSSEDVNAFPAANVLQALEGRAAGVQVLQSSGAPGAGVNVRIRGINSIQGGNEPLYVIDGFPFSGNPTHLNNSDIESIEILKDASATAIYGSRGANGVVLITTKQGGSGETKVNFDSSYSIQSIRKKLDLMNGSEYAEFNNIQAINDNGEPYFTQEEVDSFGEGTDWQDIVFSDAPILTTSLDVTGGNKKTQFSIGGSLYDQEGIIKGSDYTRYSLRTNIEHEVSDFFKVSLTNSLSRIGRESRDSGGGARGNSLIGAAISAAPISSPYNEDGTYTDLANAYPFIAPDIRNPLNFINEQTNEVVANVVLTNAALIFNPIPELTVKIAGGVENRDDRTDFYTTRNFINSNGTASVSTSQFTSLLSENTISYSDTFGEKHEVSAVAGFTYQDFLTKFVSGSGSGFLTDLSETHDLGAAAVAGIPSSGYSKSVLLSGLGRVNYSFDNKYLATVSFRSDGSSRYSEGNKWGYFPSAALAWKVSEEDFFTENDVISGLKIRTSWGLTGSQAISPYSTLNLLNSGNTVFGNTLYPLFGPSTRLPGALKWETTEQIDFGVDVGFLQNHLRINADYYVKNTRDLLNTVRLPSSMGFTTTIQNVGEVQNKGFELGVDAKVFTGDFRWDLFGNIGFNSNEVISLYNGEDILGGFVNVIAVQDNVNILREGRPIGQFWGYVEDGYTEEGMIQYRDLNDDGAINADDKTYIGDPNPDFTYGLNSSMAYKNLELTLFIQGTQGNDIFNVSAIPSTLDYGQGINMPREVLLDHWTPQNTDAKYPIISRNSSTQVSDRWVEDGSYLRLKNIQLAYNFNKLGLGLENLQVYASGQNLITLTDYSWWDPGVNSGIDHYSYPVSKVVTFGFRATF